MKPYVCYKRTMLCVEIFSKIQRNGILQTKPSVIHFDGYEVGKVHQQTLVSVIGCSHSIIIQYMYINVLMSMYINVLMSMNITVDPRISEPHLHVSGCYNDISSYPFLIDQTQIQTFLRLCARCCTRC